MICRLYELKADTDIDVGAKQDCNDQCPDYDKRTPDCPCLICSNVETKLCKKTKFGWTKVRTIEFIGVDILEDEDTAYQIIKMIHPSKQNLWIIRWVSKNKGTTEDSYSIHILTKEWKVEDLDKLNWFLKTRLEYDGRWLKPEDFEIRRNHESHKKTV